jgi:proteasome accessory factor A
MQLVLAMLEADVADPKLIVDDPVAAVLAWSHDPTLATRVRMASGKRLTAVELQLLFLEAARRFAATGGFDGIVPRADEILALWEDTLTKLRAGNADALVGRLDWLLRLRALRQAMERRPDLDWASPAVKHLDHLYSALDADTGLYWMYERHGGVERHVDEARIAQLVEEPPEDTRAWTRAMLLRLAEPHEVQDVDWDLVRFRRPRTSYWPATRVLHLDDPRAFTKAVSAPAFEGAATLDDALDVLGAAPAASESIVSLYDWGRAPAHAWSDAETVNDQRRMR